MTSAHAKFGGLEISDARRLKAVEGENVRLKRLLADAMLDNAILKDIAANAAWVRLWPVWASRTAYAFDGERPQWAVRCGTAAFRTKGGKPRSAEPGKR